MLIIKPEKEKKLINAITAKIMTRIIKLKKALF